MEGSDYAGSSDVASGGVLGVLGEDERRGERVQVRADVEQDVPVAGDLHVLGEEQLADLRGPGRGEGERVQGAAGELVREVRRDRGHQGAPVPSDGRLLRLHHRHHPHRLRGQEVQDHGLAAPDHHRRDPARQPGPHWPLRRLRQPKSHHLRPRRPGPHLRTLGRSTPSTLLLLATSLKDPSIW